MTWQDYWFPAGTAFGTDPSLAERFPSAPAAQVRRSASLIGMRADRSGYECRCAIDASRIKKELDFEPQHDFEHGLDAIIEWMLDNLPWWRAVMDGSYRDWITTQYA